MAKNTGKVREFCQSGKMGTLCMVGKQAVCMLPCSMWCTNAEIVHRWKLPVI